MKERSVLSKDYGRLRIFISSDEDIFLLKSITGDRAGDSEDCIALAKTGSDWNLIHDEIKRQISFSGNDVWITYIEERFNELVKENVNIPIMDKIRKQSHEFYEKHESG